MKKILALTVLILAGISVFAEKNNVVFTETYNSEISNLKIKLYSEDLYIKKTNNNNFSVKILSSDKSVAPVVSVNDNSIDIKAKKNNRLFGYSCKVILTLPEDYEFRNVDISHTSGDIEIDELKSGNISIESTSGDLNAGYISARKNVSLKKFSGDFDIQTITANELVISSTSGETEVDTINTKEVRFQSTSGNIEVDNMDSEDFDLYLTSGNVEIDNINTESFKTKSTSGSINLRFASVPTETSRISSTSGSINLSFLSTEGFTLEYKTSSGSFDDKIEDSHYSTHGTITKKYFGGGTDILVSTTSGSFCIE